MRSHLTVLAVLWIGCGAHGPARRGLRDVVGPPRLQGEVTVEWPRVTLHLEELSTCRRERVERVEEHVAHPVLWGPGLVASSLGMLAVGAGCVAGGLYLLDHDHTDATSLADSSADATGKLFWTGLLASIAGIGGALVGTVQSFSADPNSRWVEEVTVESELLCKKRAVEGLLETSDAAPLRLVEGQVELPAEWVAGLLDGTTRVGASPIELSANARTLLERAAHCGALESSDPPVDTGSPERRRRWASRTLESFDACTQVAGTEELLHQQEARRVLAEQWLSSAPSP
jgi:hypothetical protein